LSTGGTKGPSVLVGAGVPVPGVPVLGVPEVGVGFCPEVEEPHPVKNTKHITTARVRASNFFIKLYSFQFLAVVLFSGDFPF
jgi:hypothetical protein